MADKKKSKHASSDTAKVTTYTVSTPEYGDQDPNFPSGASRTGDTVDVQRNANGEFQSAMMTDATGKIKMTAIALQDGRIKVEGINTGVIVINAKDLNGGVPDALEVRDPQDPLRVTLKGGQGISLSSFVSGNRVGAEDPLQQPSFPRMGVETILSGGDLPKGRGVRANQAGQQQTFQVAQYAYPEGGGFAQNGVKTGETLEVIKGTDGQLQAAHLKDSNGKPLMDILVAGNQVRITECNGRYYSTRTIDLNNIPPGFLSKVTDPNDPLQISGLSEGKPSTFSLSAFVYRNLDTVAQASADNQKAEFYLLNGKEPPCNLNTPAMLERENGLSPKTLPPSSPRIKPPMAAVTPPSPQQG